MKFIMGTFLYLVLHKRGREGECRQWLHGDQHAQANSIVIIYGNFALSIEGSYHHGMWQMVKVFLGGGGYKFSSSREIPRQIPRQRQPYICMRTYMYSQTLERQYYMLHVHACTCALHKIIHTCALAYTIMAAGQISKLS